MENSGVHQFWGRFDILEVDSAGHSPKLGVPVSPKPDVSKRGQSIYNPGISSQRDSPKWI